MLDMVLNMPSYLMATLEHIQNRKNTKMNLKK